MSSSVQEHCFPRMLVRKNPIANTKNHSISNKQSEQGGKSELLLVLSTCQLQEKVTSAEILRV